MVGGWQPYKLRTVLCCCCCLPHNDRYKNKLSIGTRFRSNRSWPQILISARHVRSERPIGVTPCTGKPIRIDSIGAPMLWLAWARAADTCARMGIRPWPDVVLMAGPPHMYQTSGLRMSRMPLQPHA